MVSVTGHAPPSIYSFKPLTDSSTIHPFSLEERVNQISLEILNIRDLYPQLIAQSKEPKEYKFTAIFHAIHLRTLRNDLMGFTEDPEERDFGVALLFDGERRFIEATGLVSRELDSEIKRLIKIIDEMVFPDIDSVELLFDRPRRDYVAGFRQEAIRSQLFLEKCMQFLQKIEEHNALHPPIEGQISPVLIEWFESRISDIERELTHLEEIYRKLYKSLDDELVVYREVFERNINEAVRRILDFLAKVKQNCPLDDFRPHLVAFISRQTRLTTIQRVAMLVHQTHILSDIATGCASRLSSGFASVRTE